MVMVGSGGAGRRTKYLDQKVPDEIGDERRAALQKSYEKNRRLQAFTRQTIHLQQART